MCFMHLLALETQLSIHCASQKAAVSNLPVKLEFANNQVFKSVCECSEIESTEGAKQ